MRAEYDFTGGMRGKHADALRQGYSVTIDHADGRTTTETLQPHPGLVVLDRDVQLYFPDSVAVNRALRGLIALIPKASPPADEAK